MFIRALSVVAALALVAATEARGALEQRSPSYHYLSATNKHKRSITGQSIAFACIGGGGDCECPNDLTGAAGQLINVFPGYQCSYPNGACTWDDVVRVFTSSNTSFTH